MHLQAGALLKNGEYKIEKVLGQGGFGITYLAEQTSLGRKIALKEFFMEGLCNRDAATSHVSVPSVGSKKLVERFKQKFIKEARMIASFDNNHIISIYDVFEENGTAYYVMEYLGGKSLSAIVNEQGIMSETLAMKYIRQVADALAEVHANNLLHLDVKPANIMLNKKGEAVLIDFGISKHYDEAGNQTSSALIGTSEGYAPIEQYEAGALDSFTPATDIYALGATLFFLLTGTRPPKASEVMNYGLPELPSGVSASVRSTIETAMQPAIAKRPQSIAEFLCLVESGKMQDESDGETVLNGNEEVERRNEKERSVGVVISNVGEKSHSANNEILPPYSRQNDKDGKEEVERRNEKERSAGAVISNESEKSQENKLILLLLLLVAVAGAWFLFGGTGSGDATKRDTNIVEKDAPTSPVGEEKKKEPAVSKPVNDALSPVKKDGLWGFEDNTGKIVIPCKFDYAEIPDMHGKIINDRVYAVIRGGKWEIINKEKLIITKRGYDEPFIFYDGFSVVKHDGKFGFIDTNGKEIAPCEYATMDVFSEGFMLAKKEADGKMVWGFINAEGKETISFIYEDARRFSEGFAPVKQNGKWTYINTDGAPIVKPKYDNAWHFTEGLARVQLNGKWGFIDKSGKEVIPCRYDEVELFSDGFAAVQLNGKWGFIDKEGNEVIPCKYKEIKSSFSNGKAEVMENGKLKSIDKTGNEIIENGKDQQNEPVEPDSSDATKQIEDTNGSSQDTGETTNLEEKPKPVAFLTTGTLNGHAWVDLSLPSGLKWATCNVGASSPSDYGDYFAWGETSAKSSYTYDNSTTHGKDMSDIGGNANYDVARKQWGSSWRLPTKKEFQELLDNCTWEWTTQDGHKGYKVTSKKNGNSIFLPAAGWRNGTLPGYRGSYGSYWSATPHEGSTSYALSLYFREDSRYADWGYRDCGRSVRPLFQNN